MDNPFRRHAFLHSDKPTPHLIEGRSLVTKHDERYHPQQFDGTYPGRDAAVDQGISPGKGLVGALSVFDLAWVVLALQNTNRKR